MNDPKSGRIVFLDKDGTLVTNVPYNVAPERIALARHAPEALAMLHDAGLDIALISNQPGIALGYFDKRAMDTVRDKIAEMVAPFGVRLRGLYYCPHDPRGSMVRYAVECDCRKPASGLLRRAAIDLGVNLAESWLVGDILDDVEAGRRAGCHTILIDNGGETEWVLTGLRRPDVIVRDLAAAAHAIVTWPGAGSDVTRANQDNQETKRAS